MNLNPQTGNMYPWVTDTANIIKGKCEDHDCTYCFMHRYPQGPLRFDEKQLKIPITGTHTIFVGSSTDMWAKSVPNEWIYRVLEHCAAYPSNQYVFQTKNPVRYSEFVDMLSRVMLGKQPLLGSTIETNRHYPNISKAPTPWERSLWIPSVHFVSIEPVMDFDLDEFSSWFARGNLRFVSIGADSKGHKLPEPNAEKLKRLIDGLRKVTGVRLKANLARLLR